MEQGLIENDLTSNQCDRVFHSLPIEKKRRLLLHLDESDLSVGSYNDPAHVRHAVVIILQYVDICTWGRVKQTCSYFYKMLCDIPPCIQHIRINIDDYASKERARAFFPWLRRFIVKSGALIHKPPYSYVEEKDLFEKYQRDILYAGVSRNSMPFEGNYRVRFPEGYIIRDGTPQGTIFDANIIELLFIDNKRGSLRLRYCNEYTAEMKNIYKRVRQEWKK